jgi:hypothetical protein
MVSSDVARRQHGKLFVHFVGKFLCPKSGSFYTIMFADALYGKEVIVCHGYEFAGPGIC